MVPAVDKDELSSPKEPLFSVSLCKPDAFSSTRDWCILKQFFRLCYASLISNFLEKSRAPGKICVQNVNSVGCLPIKQQYNF